MPDAAVAATAASVAYQPVGALDAMGAKFPRMKLLSRKNMPIERVSQDPIDLPTLVVHAGKIRLPALFGLVRDMIPNAVFNKDRAGLVPTERRIGIHALLP